MEPRGAQDGAKMAQGRKKKEEGRKKREERRRKKEEGRRNKEESRGCESVSKKEEQEPRQTQNKNKSMGKTSNNIKIHDFPLNVKNTGIVRILYSYYVPPPLANFPFKIPSKTAGMEWPW